MEAKKIAYQKEGIKAYLLGLDYDFSEVYNLCEEFDVDYLRYHFNIPDTWVNKYWFMALGG